MVSQLRKFVDEYMLMEDLDSERTKHLIEKYLDVDIVEIKIIKGECRVLLSPYNDFYKLIINNYISKFLNDIQINLKILPYRDYCNDNLKFSDDIKIYYEKSQYINGYNIYILNMEKKINNLINVVDSQFNEYESMLLFNDIQFAKENLSLDFCKLEKFKKVFSKECITYDTWLDKKYYLESHNSNFSYRKTITDIFIIDPRLNIEYLYQREKINKNIEVLTIKFSYQDIDEIEAEFKNDIQCLKIANAIADVDAYIDFIVYDYESFISNVGKVRNKYQLEITVYDNFKEK